MNRSLVGNQVRNLGRTPAAFQRIREERQACKGDVFINSTRRGNKAAPNALRISRQWERVARPLVGLQPLVGPLSVTNDLLCSRESDAVALNVVGERVEACAQNADETTLALRPTAARA